MAAIAGKMTAQMGASAAFTAPRRYSDSTSLVVPTPSGLTLITSGDWANWYTYSGLSSVTGFHIRFHAPNGDVMTFAQFDTLGMKTVDIRITTQYQYGLFVGSFTSVRDNAFASPSGTSPDETMTGIITSDDPRGGKFTETMQDVRMQVETVAGASMGIPEDGTASIASSQGDYSGSFTFSKVGNNYLQTGTVTASTETVHINLTFDKTVGNYTGTYTDSTGTHAIDAK